MLTPPSGNIPSERPDVRSTTQSPRLAHPYTKTRGVVALPEVRSLGQAFVTRSHVRRGTCVHATSGAKAIGYSAAVSGTVSRSTLRCPIVSVDARASWPEAAMASRPASAPIAGAPMAGRSRPWMPESTVSGPRPICRHTVSRRSGSKAGFSPVPKPQSLSTNPQSLSSTLQGNENA